MKPLVELITAWQAFADKHPAADVESFCFDYLSNTRQRDDTGPANDMLLAKLIGKTNSLHKAYLKLALRQVPDMELEWFYLLDTIKSYDEIRKTDVVSFGLLLEPTTGIDILNRMLKAGLISERVDPADKRARLIKLTKKGIESYDRVYQLFTRVTTLLFDPFGKEQKTMIILALTNLTAGAYQQMIENRSAAIAEIERIIREGTASA